MPQVTMPQLGEGVEQGTIGKWLKAVGDHVRIGDPIVEVVTDKVNAEVPSPFEGTLTSILVAEGETIANDVAIAEIEIAGAVPAGTQAMGAPADAQAAQIAPAAPIAEAAPIAPAAPAAPAAPSAPAPVSSPAVAAGPAPATAAPSATAAPAAVHVPAGIRMTPAVRQLARQRDVDVTAIVGSGMGGRITRADIELAAAGGPAASSQAASSEAAVGQVAAAAAAAAVTPAAPLGTPESPVRDGDSLKQLSPMRKAIAAQMTRSLEVPAAYITIEVDMTPVVRARSAVNEAYKAREGIGLSFVAYVTKACVEALRKHHDLNAHWTPEGHWRRRDINIGIAVAVTDGLVVPVIHKAQDLSLHALNAAINDLAARARSKRLRPEDLQGGTFTVDNTGWTGSILTLPIINVPEVAIVTMEKIVKRPVVLEEQGDAIAVRSMMNMCIAIDHRATDGAQAGAFLADVAGWLGSVSEQTPIW
ncbi:MAG TPA: dihydrolipoamide acetyltransferase family protein [Candidatus Deferrimicrobium sp.]|nr:dihydrolipoamide acetyltransferase family protein [Candidatus Deferrimicrobium sp.]